MASTAPKACGNSHLYQITKNSHLDLSVGQAYPAGPTRSLISDLSDCGAFRPFLAGIKGVWKLYSFSIVKSEPENEQD